jgi:hypothetical protein
MVASRGDAWGAGRDESERAAEEVKAGQTKKPKTSRGKQADELI